MVFFEKKFLFVWRKVDNISFIFPIEILIGETCLQKSALCGFAFLTAVFWDLLQNFFVFFLLVVLPFRSLWWDERSTLSWKRWGWKARICLPFLYFHRQSNLRVNLALPSFVFHKAQKIENALFCTCCIECLLGEHSTVQRHVRNIHKYLQEGGGGNKSTKKKKFYLKNQEFLN